MTVVEIRRASARRVPELVRRQALRGYDAVQLAAALGVREESRSVEMWSADPRVVEPARAVGFRGVALES